MKHENYTSKVLLDKVARKDEKAIRYRHILANSGEVMESGEVRDLSKLYVMGRDGKLIKISDLNTNPDLQEEDYTVKAQADHGQTQVVMDNGEVGMASIPTIEKQFGYCKVWLEDDGLHARMYFADDDKLADHAWAISKEASYSIGVDWYEDGYNGVNEDIEDEVGVLREISMVLTGNDPRAHTIDHLTAKTKDEAEAHGSAETEVDVEDGKKLNKETLEMKTKDNLTPDERDAFMQELASVVDKFTTDAPESETEPTADSLEETEEAKAEAEAVETKTEDEAKEEVKAEEAKEETKEEEKGEKMETKDSMPISVITTNDTKQEAAKTASTADYLKSEQAVAAWGEALIKAQGDRKATADNFRKIAQTRDGITFSGNVEIIPDAVVNAISKQLEDEDSILGLVNKTGLSFEVAGIVTSEDAAKGHVRGETKDEEAIAASTRVFTPADLYKLMKLDHAMVKINGGLGSSAIVKYVLNELPRKLREAIDQAIVAGGIVNDDSGNTAFTAINSIVADVADSTTVYANEYTPEAGDNARATLSKAAARVTSGANRVYITTQDEFTNLENATAGGNLIFPNGIDKKNPNINGISRIITPLWLTSAMLGGYSGIVVDLDAFHVVGDTTPESLADYEIDTNKYVWEAVACIGGGLAAAGAAVGIVGDES